MAQASSAMAHVLVRRGLDSAHENLAQAALALTRATDVQSILEITTHAAQDIVGAHQAVTSRLIHGWDEASTYVALSDKYADYRSYDHAPKGLGVLNFVTRENRPLRLTAEELPKHPEWRGLKDAPGHPPLPNYLAAPLVTRGGGNLGLIQLSDKLHGGEFTKADEDILVQIAQMASAAIENVELIERERRERKLAETLHAVGQSVSRRRELRDIVQDVTDACTDLCGARFGAFFYNVVAQSGEEFLLYTLSGAPRSAFENFGHPRSTAIFEPTLEGTRTVRLDDVTAHPDFGKNAPHHGMPVGQLPLRSYLAVPVKLSSGSVVGGLFFGHPDVGVFTAEHERLVEGVAAHAAIAIENVRLFDSERWAREHAEERAQAALSLEYVADGVVLVDGEQVVRVWNPAAERITGIPADEVVGRRASEVLERWEEISEQIPTAGRGERGGHPRVLSVDFGAREVWISAHGVSFEEGTVYAFRDMTAERRLEEIRADMIATVSHELRTPLAAVYGAARTLQRGDVQIEEGTREVLVDMVARECERLSGIVDEFLLASSMDRQLHLDPKAVDVSNVLEEVATTALARAAEGVEFELRVDDADVHAQADEGRLKQVLMNLTDNAFKYGARGGGRVELGAQRIARRVRITVRDFGPGIPGEEQERIFERFYRLDPLQSNGINGTGLGLYISRELVTRMGGRLSVDSREGGPTTFVVDLPAAAQ